MTYKQPGLNIPESSMRYADLANQYNSAPVAPQGMSAVNTGLNAVSNIGSGAATGAAGGGPWGAIVGGVLGTAKTGFDIWQGLEAQNQAEKTYEAQKKQYEEELKRREQDRMRAEEQQRIANMYAGANAAQEASKGRDELVSYYTQRGY